MSVTSIIHLRVSDSQRNIENKTHNKVGNPAHCLDARAVLQSEDNGHEMMDGGKQTGQKELEFDQFLDGADFSFLTFCG